MPTPRIVLEADAGEREMIEDMRSDAAMNRVFAVAHASYQTDRLMPAIQAVLAEAKDLLPRNPSASVVWSVQALEFFIKNGVIEPALKFRLGFDPGLANSIFDKMFSGPGSLTGSREWFKKILGTSLQAHLAEIGRPNLWTSLWPTKRMKGRDRDRRPRKSIIEWRNDIVHHAYVADNEEARLALQAVAEFIEVSAEFLRSARQHGSAT